MIGSSLHTVISSLSITCDLSPGNPPIRYPLLFAARHDGKCFRHVLFFCERIRSLAQQYLVLVLSFFRPLFVGLGLCRHWLKHVERSVRAIYFGVFIVRCFIIDGRGSTFMSNGPPYLGVSSTTFQTGEMQSFPLFPYLQIMKVTSLVLLRAGKIPRQDNQNFVDFAL